MDDKVLNLHVDANNAMINATGKNGVNHGISHGVKEPPNRVQSLLVLVHF